MSEARGRAVLAPGIAGLRTRIAPAAWASAVPRVPGGGARIPGIAGLCTRISSAAGASAEPRVPSFEPRVPGACFLRMAGAAWLAMVAAGALPAAPPEYAVDSVALEGGGATPRLRLDNGRIAIAVLPELGGKIVSLRRVDGREFLSRSDRPYRRRVQGQEYGETEFDGIDELFPSLGSCEIASGPWQGRRVPDHGELVTLPWQVVEGPGIALEVASPVFPYVFRRTATLEDDTLVLDYAVTNTSIHPFAFTYTFHPLFAGEAGCRFDIPDALPMTVSWSKQSFLGARGEVKPWGDLPDGVGGRFRDSIFAPGSGRYYKLFSPRLSEGRFRLVYADGGAMEMRWPAGILPHYAIWCSEGGVGSLHHIGLEPTTDTVETLVGAIADGVAPEIPAKGSRTWQIRLRLIPSAS